MTQPLPAADSARRARTRRLALLFTLAASGVYAGFIVLQVLRAKG